MPNELAVRRIKTQVDDAVKKGGRVLAGGDINGFLIEPTIIDLANPEMIGMRNRLVHGYDVIDFDLLWDTVKTDLPLLISSLQETVDGSS